MEKLGLMGAPAAPAAKMPSTLKELSRNTENAKKDFDRGMTALQKRKFDEAERNFLDLIQKYAGGRARGPRPGLPGDLRAPEEGRRAGLVAPEDFYYAALLEKNRGNVPEAIEHLKQAARRTAAAAWTSKRAATR